MHFKTTVTLITSFYLIFFPIVVLADDYIEEDLSYLEDLKIETSSEISNEPLLNARHAIVFDRCSQTVLFGKSENEICKIASTTKIMTAIITIENCTDLNANVVVSKNAARNRWF